MVISKGEYELQSVPNFGEWSKRLHIFDFGRVGMILKGVFDQTFHYLWLAVGDLKVGISDFPIVILYIKYIENQPKVFEVGLNFKPVMKSFLVKNTF